MSFQEFQKAPNRLSSQEIIFLIVSGVVILLVLYGLAIGNSRLAGYLPQGGEFSLLRTAGRAFLFDRIEPYSGTIPSLVQEQVYGRAAGFGEDIYILDIPFHLLIFFFPLALFPDAPMAQTFWMALSEIAVAVFIYFSFRLIDRRISPLFIALIAIAGFSSYYALRSFFEGSPVLLLGLVYVALLLSLRADYDELSGALMTLAAFQWEIGGLFLLFVVIWVIWERRWRVFAGAGMLAFVLFALSFFWYPGWILPFLRAAWNSLRVGFGFSTHELLEQSWPQYGGTLAWVLTAILIFLIGYEWRAARGKHFSHYTWVACLTLGATPLLGHHVEMDHLFPLTLPIILVIIILRERWKKLGDGIAILLLGFYFGLPWLVSVRGLPEGVALNKDEFLFLFWPVFTVVGLYWMRWWMVRPPRTWLDNFAHKERK
jgi:hypothetical protein